jgi:hypothetical protein
MSDASIELLVALSDLKRVRSIRGAVKANLIAAGGVPGPLGTVQMPGRAGDAYVPSARFESRPVHEPTPRFQPRPVIEPTPRVDVPPQFAPLHPEQPARLANPLTPPWKMPPQIESSSGVPQVKYEVRPPDVISKGSLLDLFC